MTNEQTREYMEKKYMDAVVSFLNSKLHGCNDITTSRIYGEVSIIEDMYSDIFEETIWFTVENTEIISFYTESKSLGQRAY